MAGRPETKQYWMDQLSEYWNSGFTIQEYCELKELSYESKRPVRYMSGAFRTNADWKLKIYLEAGFQNGGSMESI